MDHAFNDTFAQESAEHPVIEAYFSGTHRASLADLADKVAQAGAKLAEAQDDFERGYCLASVVDANALGDSVFLAMDADARQDSSKLAEGVRVWIFERGRSYEGSQECAEHLGYTIGHLYGFHPYDVSIGGVWTQGDSDVIDSVWFWVGPLAYWASLWEARIARRPDRDATALPTSYGLSCGPSILGREDVYREL